jgi:large subunit ribosomal protein L6
MSRIGKLPVDLPAGVEVRVDENNLVTVKGPNGELFEQVSKLVKIEINDNTLLVKRAADDKTSRAQHGLARTLVNNMVIGVTAGFSKRLLITGVGYKAEKKGDVLVINLGYSHPVELKDPVGIKTEVNTPTEIIVKGMNKAVVGNYAADIRAWRKPEPYKGKGVRYENEVIRRKEGKTGKK